MRRSRLTGKPSVAVTNGVLAATAPGHAPLRVISSAQWRPVLHPDSFGVRFLKQHEGRLTGGGRCKGRVLYLREGDGVLAALIWTLSPPGLPLAVLGAAASDSFGDEDRGNWGGWIEVLLDCLRETAVVLGERPQRQLAWIVPRSRTGHHDITRDRVCDLLGFVAVDDADVPEYTRSHHRAAHYLLRDV